MRVAQSTQTRISSLLFSLTLSISLSVSVRLSMRTRDRGAAAVSDCGLGSCLLPAYPSCPRGQASIAFISTWVIVGLVTTQEKRWVGGGDNKGKSNRQAGDDDDDDDGVEYSVHLSSILSVSCPSVRYRLRHILASRPPKKAVRHPCYRSGIPLRIPRTYFKHETRPSPRSPHFDLNGIDIAP